MSSAEVAPKLWLGPWVHEAVAAYHRARAAGLSVMRALAIGNVASFKDGWAFRSTLAGRVGCSVRTVGRALEQAKREGLVGVARAKKGERPVGPNGEKLAPLHCGWSHRWTIGWGRAGAAVKLAIDTAKAKFMARASVKGKVLPERKRPARTWTAEEIEAELARRESRPPPERTPPT